MNAEPQGPALPPTPVPAWVAVWLHRASLALVPFLVSGGVWLAYHQGTQDRSIAVIEAKAVEVAMMAAKDTAAVNARAHRIRDDFDAYKLAETADMMAVKAGIARIQQILEDRLPPPSPGKRASLGGVDGVEVR